MSQLKVNSIIPVSGVPTGGGGGIIQVVQAVKDDTATFTTTSFTDITGLSASITPTSNSSKILVEAVIYVSNNGNTTGIINLVRGSTNIAQPSGSVTNTASIFSYIGGAYMVQRVMTFLDSPATTSATTYKLQIRGDNTNSSLKINRYSETSDYYGVSTLTLREVSA
tara:strand:- start:139 stop:639 length:501 start_codon:yes stop_codon:yes gene_type:complete